MQFKQKHFTYNPAATNSDPEGTLGALAVRGETRTMRPGVEGAWWHLEDGTYQGHEKIWTVYFTSSCELYVHVPGGGRWPQEIVRTHSMEEGVAALGLTVELY